MSTENTTQKLESIAKIMLATGAINYMASCVSGVNEQIKFVPDPEGYHKQGIIDKDNLLNEVKDNLYTIMEKLGDYMNNTDCISPIDVRATEQAFAIVSGEKDDVEEE